MAAVPSETSDMNLWLSNTYWAHSENDAAKEALQVVRLISMLATSSCFVLIKRPHLSQSDETRETNLHWVFQRVLQRAVFHVQLSGRSEVTGANVLVAIFSEQESLRGISS